MASFSNNILTLLQLVLIMIAVTKNLIEQLENFKTNGFWLPQEDLPESKRVPEQLLLNAAKSFIHSDPETLNVDLIDLNTVLNVSGSALISSAIANGPDRALTAIQQVLTRTGEQKELTKNCQTCLLSIFSGPTADLELEELTLVTEYLQQELSVDTEVIFGHGIREDLDNKIQILVVASAHEKGVPELV